MDVTAHLREHGYAIVRGVYGPEDLAVLGDEMDRLEAHARRFRGSYRDQNLLWVVRDDPVVGRHLRFVHWPAYTSDVFARYRVDPRQNLAPREVARRAHPAEHLQEA